MWAFSGCSELLLLLLSHCSRVWLCETHKTAAHQAPPSLGFSRQEHWSGLPFPSPMHESEKWKWSHSVTSDSAIPWSAAYQAPPSMEFSRQEHWCGVPVPSPVAVSRGYRSSCPIGISPWWLLFFQSTSSGACRVSCGSWAVEHSLNSYGAQA